MLQQFLSPYGPLFKLIDKLQADGFLRYEFFVQCLPVGSIPCCCMSESRNKQKMYEFLHVIMIIIVMMMVVTEEQGCIFKILKSW